MASNEMVIINKFLNMMWQYIKKWDIPCQTDIGTWDARDDDRVKWMDKFFKDYSVTREMEVLFNAWVASYELYIRDVSCGIPTLLQECNRMKGDVLNG